MLASLKSTGKGAIILPHGVLFRGNKEADIRQNIIERKWIKGIIGLPANLFYGTGIPACIIVLDKEAADQRTGIFMIDASKGFIKDGNKNRLREQDIHKIVNVFNHQKGVAKFARFVPFEEIEKNEYNLNIPRYIDTQEAEDIQDLMGHLQGGIPNRDIESLDEYWEVYPSLKQELFAQLREGYSQLNVDKAAIKDTIFNHPEFKGYSQTLDGLYEGWSSSIADSLNHINNETAPKKLIEDVAEQLLASYHNKALVDKYSIYQHLLNYWNETMKDDVYMIVEDGWEAKVRRLIEKKKNKEVDKGWTCDLLPKSLIIEAYLGADASKLQELQANLESLQSEIGQVVEEHTGEEGLLVDAVNKSGKVTKGTVVAEMKKIKGKVSEKEAYDLMQSLKKRYEEEGSLKKDIKKQEIELDKAAFHKYSELTEADVKKLLIEEKWLANLQSLIQTEINSISQSLTSRVKELAERYRDTLGALDAEVKNLEVNVTTHLQKMGLVWS